MKPLETKSFVLKLGNGELEIEATLFEDANGERLVIVKEELRRNGVRIRAASQETIFIG